MRRSLQLVCALVVAALPARAQTTAMPSQAPPSRPLDRVDLEAWLDGVVPAALAKNDIAGLVVSVVKDGKPFFSKGYGYADVARKIPMDPAGTLLRMASVSKTFTGTAVMQLVEQGKLDLDRDVNGYLDFAIPETFGKPITLRNLLTHTAGFEETSYKRHVPPTSLRSHLEAVPDRIYPPGEIPAYSNYGLNLAGYIVERVSGENFTQYIERHIMVPLGMHRSTFHVTLPDSLLPFEAKLYPRASEPPYSPTLIPELAPIDAPAAGLASTADDMMRYMLAHLQQGDVALMRPETMETMHAPSFVPIPGTQPVALGMFRADANGRRVIGHSGDGEGVHADMKLLLDDRVGFFTAVNSDGVTEAVFPTAFDLRAVLFQQFLDRYFPGPVTPQEPTIATAREHARLAAGEYFWARQQKGDYQEAIGLIGRYLGLKLIIKANDDGTIETPGLMTFDPSGRTHVWHEVAPFVWRDVAGEARLFMKVENGRVHSVWSDASASFWVNLKAPYLWSAGLNVPLLGLSAAGLLLTLVVWPVAVIVRRRSSRAVVIDPATKRARRATLFAVIVGILYLFGWAIAMSQDFASTVGAERWIRLIQILGLLCIVGALAAIRHAVLTWRSRSGNVAKMASLVPAVSLVYLVWFSFAFHLLSIRLG